MSESTSAKTWGVLAEYETPKALYHACESVRDHGYAKWDAHTPFPVHGLDKAMGMKRSKLPFIVFALGFTGATVAMVLQWWVHVVRYPLVFAAKPYFSWPAFVPVTFELMVLFAAATAVIAMFGLSKLPMHYHPIFSSDRFDRCSDDRFFISIEAADPKFDTERTWALLSNSGASHVEWVEDGE